MGNSQQIKVIDSHTGGEPTRIIVAGGPDLGRGSMAERRAIFRDKFDHVRRATVEEPRGSDVIVGGILCEPVDPTCATGVVYFNNAGVLRMCGHGTIGLVVTLAYLSRIEPGTIKIETPVGVVTATLHNDHRVTIQNVASYRYRKAVSIEVDGAGTIVGDIAWGGNWFFLASEHNEEVVPENLERLFQVTRGIRKTLDEQGITGADGGVIDHIEIFGPPSDSAIADSRNFVLCPGSEYDRSPCGTGTSAKLACLAEDGKLQPGEVWRQESIVGSLFEGTYELDGDDVIPSITGEAFVNAESTLILNDADPFCWGIGE